METAKRILVVDDEPQILRALRKSLTINQFDVRTAADGESAMDLFHDWSPDMVITDLSMPEMNGLELCRAIRKLSEVPIIILSVKGEEKTKVEALDIGADDYITKPFGIDELLARIRAAMRRAPASGEAMETKIEIGDFSLDLNARQIFVRGTEVHLTPKEFELLVFFIKNHGRIITHRTLLEAVWGRNSSEQNEYLRVFIGQLRKKIEPNPAQPRYVLTDPWIGYRFNP